MICKTTCNSLQNIYQEFFVTYKVSATDLQGLNCLVQVFAYLQVILH